MKVGLVAASLVLVAGSATGCSNSASTEEFCQGYVDFTEALLSIEGDDTAENVEAVKDAAKDFQDVGVPDDMSDDAKEGYELVLDAISELDEDSTLDDLQENDFSEDEQKKADAFEKYLDKCEDTD